jgi:GNAT superfamily N-acetyltransferase
MSEAPEIPTTLRTATAADTEAAHALLRELGYATLEPGAFAIAFAAVLADPSQRVWLAEREGRVVGLMSMSQRPQLRLAGTIVTIDEMVVTEGARGAGIGAALLQIAKSHAAALGARRLELTTARGRPSYARGFYVKCGLVEADSAVMRWPGVTS